MSRTSMTPRPRNKAAATAAANRQFIHTFHRNGIDNGAIAVFGNELRVVQDFTNLEGVLHAGLDRYEAALSAGPGEGTRLYDSLADMVERLRCRPAPVRPCLIFVVTDGQDTRSVTFRNNPAGLGRHLHKRFTAVPENHIVLVGVGDGKQIDRVALAAIAEHGNIQVLTVDTFPELGSVLSRLATQLTPGVRVSEVRVGAVRYVEQTQEVRVRCTPLDFVLMLDGSGSMREAV